MRETAKIRNLGPMLKLNLVIMAEAKYAVAILAAIGLALSIGGIQFGSIFLVIMGYSLMVQLFNVEYKHNMAKLYSALPTTRRTVVSARYLSAVFLLFGIAVVSGLQVALITFFGSGVYASDMLYPLGALFTQAMLLATLIPAFIAFGPQKYGYVLLCILGVFAVLGGIFAGITWFLPQWLTWISERPVMLTTMGLAVVAVAWCISWTVSNRIYARKDL